MGDKTAIQWADATWNPTTGCDRVSPGCANCYALTLAARLKKMGQPLYQTDGDPKTSGPGFGLALHPEKLDQPLRWKRPRRIFVNSMSDLFHPDVPDAFLDQTFAVMALAPQHIFQVLTKRPERMREYMTDDDYPGVRMRIFNRMEEMMPMPGIQTLQMVPWPIPWVWLGTSVENARWRTRIDELRVTPAAVRFLSCEPLLGPLASPGMPIPGQPDEEYAYGRHWSLPNLDLTDIDWVIIGGESGQGARRMEEQWVRDIIAACREQGSRPFVKQMGQVWSREHLGHSGHAGNIEEFPEDLRIREMPR